MYTNVKKKIKNTKINCEKNVKGKNTVIDTQTSKFKNEQIK